MAMSMDFFLLTITWIQHKVDLQSIFAARRLYEQYSLIDVNKSSYRAHVRNLENQVKKNG